MDSALLHLRSPSSETELSAGRPVLSEQYCVCEGATCEPDHRCSGQHCFSSLKMIDGAAVQQKGCLRDDEEGRATCATPPSPAHVVKCCQGHLCNMNVTMRAPGKGDFVHCVHISFLWTTAPGIHSYLDADAISLCGPPAFSNAFLTSPHSFLFPHSTQNTSFYISIYTYTMVTIFAPFYPNFFCRGGDQASEKGGAWVCVRGQLMCVGKSLHGPPVLLIFDGQRRLPDVPEGMF